VCRSISCALRGGEEVLERLCHAAGIRPGETTPDGKLTIEFAECLGACEFAPCMLGGDILYKDLDREPVEKVLAELKSMNSANGNGQSRQIAS
jgi:NADH-quinone oxidoreductase subunit E